MKRMNIFLLDNRVVNGRCKFCGEKIPGIWGKGPEKG